VRVGLLISSAIILNYLLQSAMIAQSGNAIRFIAFLSTYFVYTGSVFIVLRRRLLVT